MATTLPNTGAIIPEMTEQADQAVNNVAFTAIDAAVGAHLAESASKHITESGTNPNGSYIRFDDGTQICLITKVVDMNLNTWQGIFYPAEFAIGQPVSLSASYHTAPITGADGDFYHNVKNISLHHSEPATGLLLYDGSLQEVTGYAYIQAIGRWK